MGQIRSRASCQTFSVLISGIRSRVSCWTLLALLISLSTAKFPLLGFYPRSFRASVNKRPMRRVRQLWKIGNCWVFHAGELLN